MRGIVTAAVARLVTALIGAALLLVPLAGPATADGGLEVTTPYQAVAVAPGSSVSFDLTVTSTRAADVSLVVSDVPTGWTATLRGGGFVVDGVVAAPDQNGTLRLDVAVPADAASTTQTLQVIATAGTARDVRSISVRVNEEAAGDITLTTNTPTLAGASDSTYTFNLNLQNDTAQDVTVSASAAGEPGWTLSATLTGETQAASTIVEAGASQAISVTADPPENAAAGTYPVSVSVLADERTITADLAIEITGSFSLSVATPNDLLSASGSAGSPTEQVFVVTNTGTAPLVGVELSATQPTNWDVTFEPATVDVEPGGASTVTALISPSADAVAGDYVVTVRASSDEANDSAEVRFTVQTSPVWAFIGIAIIAAIIGGLFLVFRTYGRR